MSAVASPIRVIRRSQGITAEQLAARAGLASATVYRAERGIGRPSEETLAAIASVLGVEPSELHDPDATRPANGRGTSDNDQAPTADSSRSSAVGAR
jgi:transcriptional regulator with XRE-family HTH domain